MSVADFLRRDGWFLPGAGPRYLQLRRRLADGVERGILAPGSPLPPEREIAAITEFSRVTVRKAIQSLAGEGTIVQRQGSGSFVAARPLRFEQRLSRLTSFSEDMARRGRTVSVRWLERGLFLAAPEEVAALGLPPEATVARLARLRLADGAPLAIERASLPVEVLANPLEVEASLYEVLERHGTRPVRALQKLSAVNLDPDTAALLSVLPGAAGLRIERTSFLESGRAVEFTRSIYRGDAYDFVAELRLEEE